MDGRISLSKKRVLVAEPDKQTEELIVATLKKERFDVFSVVTGNAVLDRLRPAEHSRLPNIFFPDLLILSLAQPDLNGLEICRIIRQHGHNLPILMISSRASEVDCVVGLEVGADDYLVKPFGIREFIARCQVLLRRSPNQPSYIPNAVLIFQDLEIHLELRRVLRQDQEVTLSPKEFALLALLMKYPRQVLSREQLLEQIWGSDFLGDPKTVDVHIRWLREKIEPDPKIPQYIQTVRGFGYRFG